MRYLLLFWLLLGCSGLTSSRLPEPPPTTRIVHMDPEFSRVETSIIRGAFNEWHDATHGIINWKFDDWVYGENQTEIRSDEERKSGICYRHLLMMRTISESQLGLSAPPAGASEVTLGYAYSSLDVCGTDVIVLIMDHISSNNELRLVSLHEIGHNLGMNHNKEMSIMNNSGRFVTNHLTRYDLNTFCSIWKCDVNRLL